MAWRDEAMFDLELLAQPAEDVVPAGLFFLLLLVNRSVNWLPLSMSNLQILIGQAAFTLARKSTLLHDQVTRIGHAMTAQATPQAST
jgi:hypothetical protein